MAAATAMTAVQQLSSITGFDETLLNKLHVILVAFSCNHYINSEKFRIFCEKKFENASEARNKIYKKDRLSHARKNSRINTMTDLFHRAIDSLDPLLSSVCLKERERKNIKKHLPKEVLSLLELQSTENKNPNEKETDVQSDSDYHEDLIEGCSIELEEEDDV